LRLRVALFLILVFAFFERYECARSIQRRRVMKTRRGLVIKKSNVVPAVRISGSDRAMIRVGRGRPQRLKLRRPTYAAKRALLYKKQNSRSIAPSQRATVLYNIKRLQANRPKRLLRRPSSIAKRSPQLQEQRYTVRFEKGGILRGFGKELMNSILPGIFRQGIKNNATTPNNNNNTISNQNGAKKNQTAAKKSDENFWGDKKSENDESSGVNTYYVIRLHKGTVAKIIIAFFCLNTLIMILVLLFIGHKRCRRWGRKLGHDKKHDYDDFYHASERIPLITDHMQPSSTFCSNPSSSREQRSKSKTFQNPPKPIKTHPRIISSSETVIAPDSSPTKLQTSPLDTPKKDAHCGKCGGINLGSPNTLVINNSKKNMMDNMNF